MDIKFECVNNFNLLALTEKEYFIKDIPEKYIYNGNSLFLDLYKTTGIFGLLIFILIFYNIYKFLLRKFDKILLISYGIILVFGSLVNYSLLNLYYFINSFLIISIVNNNYLGKK